MTNGYKENPEQELDERIINIERLFNLREGMTRADDILPPRYLQEPLKDGAAKGKKIPLKEMLAEYYKARDWDMTSGYPRKEKLHALGLSVDSLLTSATSD